MSWLMHQDDIDTQKRKNYEELANYQFYKNEMN